MVVIGALALAAVILLVAKSDSRPEKSTQANKALLKHLLEGFGLEIPDELREQEEAVVRSIKTH